MKKFLSKITIFLLLFLFFYVLLCCFGFFVIDCQYQYDYNASLIDKVYRLKSINEPKIILVGNSNLAFGINSKMIQDSLKMPVVNLGLHGGLGNAFHENIAKLNINSGDIVVVCHTNFSDNDTISDNLLAWVTVEYHKELWEILRGKDYPGMLRAYPHYLHRTIMLYLTFQGNKKPQNTSYARTSFNEYGDICFRPSEGITQPIFNDNSVKVPEINDVCTKRLNELNNYVKTRGATLLIAGYPICYGQFTPPVEEFEKFQNKLAEQVECEIISDYKDYFIPYEKFYNPFLHLDEEGTEIRTAQLIKDIKKWQEKNCF